MTRTCVVCKRQPSLGDNKRSFHKFPNDCNLKKKWMDAVGVTSVRTSYSTVCSEHFDPEAFHETNGYTHVRRLLQNAIPKNQNENYTSNKLQNKEEEVCDKATSDVTLMSISDVTVNQTSINSLESNATTGTSDVNIDLNIQDALSSAVNNNSDINNSITTCDSSLDDIIMNSTDITPKYDSNVISNVNSRYTCTKSQQCLSNNSIKNNILHNSINRKHPGIYTENTTPMKRFHWMDGQQTKHITRAHFSSDEVWNDFVGFVAYKNAQNIKNRLKK